MTRNNRMKLEKEMFQLIIGESFLHSMSIRLQNSFPREMMETPSLVNLQYETSLHWQRRGTEWSKRSLPFLDSLILL